MKTATFVIYVGLRCPAVSIYPIEEWKKEITVGIVCSRAVFSEPALGLLGAKSNGPGMCSDDESRGFLDYNIFSESGEFSQARTQLQAAGFELDATIPAYLPKVSQ